MPRAGDRCPPARAGSASREHGMGSEADGIAPAIETRCSCIACSRADWVRGLARLISSAIRSCANTGPLMKRNDRRPLSPSSSTSEPRMSAGMRSGVHWMRFSSRPSTVPRVSVSRVLASPGTPINSACPPARSVIRVSSTTSCWPKMTRPTDCRTWPIASPSVSMSLTSFLSVVVAAAPLSVTLKACSNAVETERPASWRNRRPIPRVWQSTLPRVGLASRPPTMRQTRHPGNWYAAI